MDENAGRVMMITGSSRGIGRYLVEHYLARGYRVVGCSRKASDLAADGYEHFELDVADEPAVTAMFKEVARRHGRLDVLINNAGAASMNHILLTPLGTLRKLVDVNVVGTFLFTREAAKLMKKHRFGRIVNFASVATPLKLEGEAVYAASKAAIVNFTQVTAKELAPLGITVNAVGPTPIETDLIRAVPKEKIAKLIESQAIRRMGEFRDVSNVIDFFISPESDFVSGQVIYLGGV
jgi:3-oxoacyl-[acyl-carrier protein] reductase